MIYKATWPTGQTMRWLSFTIIKVSAVGIDGTGKEAQDRWKDWIIMATKISDESEGTRATYYMMNMTQRWYWHGKFIMAPHHFILG